ncbi:MAG: rod shape-determining protein RodA [Candidatus Cloacimonetes bacterium]|nr:rod shape-determining protein RodA [Candidatus Cloacimonadota bacterium]
MKIIPAKLDWGLLMIYLALVFCGMIIIYSASASSIDDEIVLRDYFFKQVIWFSLSFVTMLLIINIPVHILDIFITPMYLLSILLLIVVLFMPPINGSHRWIPFGITRFQPSELAKIATILMVAKSISKPFQSDTKILLWAIGLTIVPVLLIIVEPDLGTSLVFLFIVFVMLSFSSLSFYYLIILSGPIFSILLSFNPIIFVLFILLYILILNINKVSWLIISIGSIFNVFLYFILPVLWGSLKNYQQNRILTFLDPTRDPFGAGYQIIQSKIAIGSGKLWGKGFLKGTQKNLDFLPEHHTDFIFSVLGEEFGFLGCSALLLLFFLLIIKILHRYNSIESLEHRLAIIGIMSFILFQIFTNMGMNVGLVPTTGIPLPFISYGGSNLLINTIAIAYVLRLKTLRKKRTK